MMDKNEINPPVLLVNKKNGAVYEHQTGNEFKNLSTGKTGEITREKAMASLVMPVKLNYLVDKNPHMLDLIRKFSLVIGLNQSY
jgi:hypothetical protein